MQPVPAKVPADRHGPVRGILFDKDGTLLEPIADRVIASIANLDDVLRPPMPPRVAATDMHACARSAR